MEHYTLNPDQDCKSCSISLQTIIRLLYHFTPNKFSEDSDMNKSERDKYWTELIQTCRVSGLSDYEWCRMNHISTSSFYYNVKKLRMAACNDAAAVVLVHEKQEVVPIHYNELKDNNSTIPNYCDEKSDIKIEFNEYSIAINNSADSRIIAATLNALQQIC